MTLFQGTVTRLFSGLFRSLPATALTTTALVSGLTLLSQQSVQAANYLQFPPDPTGGIIAEGPYSIEIVDKPTNISTGDFSIYTGPGAVDFDFLFATDPIEGGQAGSMKYFITSTAGNFLNAEIGGLCPNLNPSDICSVTKSFTDVNLNDLFFEDDTTELTMMNGNPVKKNFKAGSQVDQMYVFITYYGNGSGAQLTEIVDSYQTPGPLPVLGAGAAFGFSRKLRGRIKASRQG